MSEAIKVNIALTVWSLLLHLIIISTLMHCIILIWAFKLMLALLEIQWLWLEIE